MTVLDDLIKQLSETSEESRGLDCAIFCATSESPFTNYYPDCILATLGGFSARVEIDDVPRLTSDEREARQFCERILPGWWWRIGTCHLSDDATIAPDYNHPVHGERLHREFPCVPHEDGCGGWLVDIDQRPPQSVAKALVLAVLKAKKRIEDHAPLPS